MEHETKFDAWVGKRFRLKQRIPALQLIPDYIRDGETLEILRELVSVDATILHVGWNGKKYAVFAIDLDSRGVEVKAKAQVR